MDPSLMWLATVLGFVVLGVAIAYGMDRNRRRNALDRARTEAGTQEIYREEEHGPATAPAADASRVGLSESADAASDAPDSSRLNP